MARKMELRSGTRILLVALALLLVLGGVAGGQEKPKPPPKTKEKPRGDLAVTVTGSEKPMKSCTLYVKDQQLPVPRAGEPVLAKGLPVGKAAALAEALVQEEPSKPARRYIGVAEVTIEAGKTASGKITLRPVDDIDAFCMGCHPDARDPNVKILPGQIVKDIHASNRPLGEKYLAQVKTYNDTIERLKKERKPHNIPMVLDERTIIVEGKEKKVFFYTCETCHTLHLQTPWTRNIRAPFRPKSDLCVGCHY